MLIILFVNLIISIFCHVSHSLCRCSARHLYMCAVWMSFTYVRCEMRSRTTRSWLEMTLKNAFAYEHYSSAWMIRTHTVNTSTESHSEYFSVLLVSSTNQHKWNRLYFVAPWVLSILISCAKVFLFICIQLNMVIDDPLLRWRQLLLFASFSRYDFSRTVLSAVVTSHLQLQLR